MKSQSCATSVLTIDHSFGLWDITIERRFSLLMSDALGDSEIHGNHGGGVLLSAFLFLVCGALATGRVSCLSSSDRD